MKLKELKARVYALAEVTTTQQLKAKYKPLKTLDMRRKDSWQSALTHIQSDASATTVDQATGAVQSKTPHQTADSFATWSDNPPEEYKELFAEIDATSTRYQNKLKEAQHLSKTLSNTANELDTLADDYQTEAKQLKQDIDKTRKISQQAKLN